MISKTRMLALVRALEWQEVGQALRDRPDLVSFRDRKGRSWLHLCCGVRVAGAGRTARASIHTADALLEAGLDIDEPAFTEGAWKATPLWYSIAIGGNVALARHLLERGCDPDHCLWAAINRDSGELVRLLIDRGAKDPSDPTTSLLIVAVHWRKAAAVEALLELGSDVDFQDPKGMTALHHALKRRPDPALVRRLLEHGARTDIPDARGATAARILSRKRNPALRALARTARAVAVSAAVTLGAMGPLDAQEVRLGAVAGVTGARLTVDDPSAPPWARRVGGIAGLSVGLWLGSSLALQAELASVDRGARGEDGWEMHSRYLEVPVYLRWTPGRVAGLAPSALGGVTLGWERSCEGWARPGGFGEPPPGLVPLHCGSMRTDAFDAGLLMGVGIDLALGAAVARLDLRYVRGLSDIASGYTSVEVANRTVLGVVGVEVPIRR